MQTFTVEIDGTKLTVERDEDGKFIVPNEWRGIGTALKPALEPVCLARKPLSERTIAANVLRWGTGALNIDGCRVATNDALSFGSRGLGDGIKYGKCKPSTEGVQNPMGRWPANVIHDGSDEVTAGFPETSDSKPGVRNNHNQGHDGWGGGTIRSGPLYSGHSDSGSAARFFYSAKADAEDRSGSKHPTVKPVDLMQYLCRLITPPNGIVLDPFAGSGSTGEAAWREGFSCVLIEREVEYLADIRRRLEHADQGPVARAHSRIKAAGRAEGHEDLPMFAGVSNASL